MADEDFRQITVRIKRAQAERGLFKKYVEFEALCLSPAGYSPAAAAAALAVYASDDLTASEMCDEAREHRKYWDAALKATDADRGNGEDGGIQVVIAPWASAKGASMDGTTLRIAAVELVERGWVLTPPPPEDQDADDKCVLSWIEAAK